MFGSRSGSPYPGASGLLNSGNASAGPGGALSAAGNVPPPSGGMPQSSVYNRTLDNEPNVVPSQFIFPSSHPDLKGAENKIREGDFLFVLKDMMHCYANEEDGNYAESFRCRHPRLSKDEVPLVTVQKLNQLLRNFASKALDAGNNVGADSVKMQVEERTWEGDKLNFCTLDTAKWWQDPELVAQWAVPFGAALNSVQLNRYGGGGDPNNRNNREDWQAHNVVVSRKANVKNNFYSIKAGKGEKWHSQSMQRVGVQYSVEQVLLAEDVTPVPCVQVCFLLLDDPTSIACSREWKQYLEPFTRTHPIVRKTVDFDNKAAAKKADYEKQLKGPRDANKAMMECSESIVIEAENLSRQPTVRPSGYLLFEKKPLGDPIARTIVQIGRVLHSAPRQPSAYECLTSCHNKYLYDSLKPIEIEIGCP